MENIGDKMKIHTANIFHKDSENRKKRLIFAPE